MDFFQVSPHSSNERMIVEKGQEVIISYADTSKCFHESRSPLVDGETNGFAISESRIDACLRFIEEGARGGGCCRRAAKGGEISVRVKFN